MMGILARVKGKMSVRSALLHNNNNNKYCGGRKEAHFIVNIALFPFQLTLKPMFPTYSTIYFFPPVRCVTKTLQENLFLSNKKTCVLQTAATILIRLKEERRLFISGLDLLNYLNKTSHMVSGLRRSRLFFTQQRGVMLRFQ